MKERDHTPEDPNERLDPDLYSAMAKVAWRMPQTEAEVRVAEDLVGNTPGKLPTHLGAMRDADRSERDHAGGGSILSRYLRDDGPSQDKPVDGRSSDRQEPEREPER